MFFLFLLLNAGPSLAKAQVMSGNWKMISAGCANPAFQYTPEEKAFINAIEHVGSYPWTDDVIRFTSGNAGIWDTSFIEERNAACIVHHSFQWSIDDHQDIHFVFGASTSEAQVSDPNMEISCDAGDPADQGKEEVYHLKTKSEDQLILSLPGELKPDDPRSCGGYHFDWVKEIN
jgi:hypothetical protein